MYYHIHTHTLSIPYHSIQLSQILQKSQKINVVYLSQNNIQFLKQPPLKVKIKHKHYKQQYDIFIKNPCQKYFNIQTKILYIKLQYFLRANTKILQPHQISSIQQILRQNIQIIFLKFMVNFISINDFEFIAALFKESSKSFIHKLLVTQKYIYSQPNQFFKFNTTNFLSTKNVINTKNVTNIKHLLSFSTRNKNILLLTEVISHAASKYLQKKIILLVIHPKKVLMMNTTKFQQKFPLKILFLNKYSELNIVMNLTNI
eukprot:TRINITY_DN29743_c0_g3_i2.p1 TRINITY_DN29743_c0_g3~~TRINITY_DN29743_c0_g3_i2.p1  ORF type:complete len:259 (+),score=-27.58 TRINITY_DN29743_c0_g3_i2:285-1061(+)